MHVTTDVFLILCWVLCGNVVGATSSQCFLAPHITVKMSTHSSSDSVQCTKVILLRNDPLSQPKRVKLWLQMRHRHDITTRDYNERSFPVCYKFATNLVWFAQVVMNINNRTVYRKLLHPHYRFDRRWSETCGRLANIGGVLNNYWRGSSRWFVALAAASAAGYSAASKAKI